MSISSDLRLLCRRSSGGAIHQVCPIKNLPTISSFRKMTTSEILLTPLSNPDMKRPYYIVFDEWWVHLNGVSSQPIAFTNSVMAIWTKETSEKKEFTKLLTNTSNHEYPGGHVPHEIGHYHGRCVCVISLNYKCTIAIHRSEM